MRYWFIVNYVLWWTFLGIFIENGGSVHLVAASSNLIAGTILMRGYIKGKLPYTPPPLAARVENKPLRGLGVAVEHLWLAQCCDRYVKTRLHHNPACRKRRARALSCHDWDGS